MQNYTIHDLASYGNALLVFSLFLFAPGYVLGWLLDLFQFRQSSWMQRAVVSIPLSVALAGSLSTLIARFSSLAVALWVFEVFGIVCVALLVWESLTRPGQGKLRLNRGMFVPAIVLLAFCAIVIAILVDVQIGKRLYLSVANYDHCIRVAITRSVVRNGVPPANPFFYPAARVPIRYYYFWPVIVALPTALAGIDPRLSMYASCAWSGIATMAMVPLYLKFFCGEGFALRRRSLLGIGLFAVAGLDLVSSFVARMMPVRLQLAMIFHIADQVTIWFNSFLWVPHHVAALVAGLMGFLLLWDPAGTSSRSHRVTAVILASFAFASCAGYSIYVTFTFALFMLVWFVVLLRQRRMPEIFWLCLTGILTFILSRPYLHELSGPGSGAGTGFAAFRFRRLPLIEGIIAAYNVHPGWVQSALRLVSLPVGYLFQIGFFFAIIVLQWKADRPRFWKGLSRPQQALWCMLGVSLFVATFLRSQTIGGANDLAWRAALVFQFVSLIWAVPIMESVCRRHSAWPRKTVVFLSVLLAAGLAGSAWHLHSLRTYAFEVDAGKDPHPRDWLPRAGRVGTSAYNERQFYEALSRILPADAVVQRSPRALHVARLLYQDQQSAAGVGNCGTEFGGDIAKCQPFEMRLARLFYNPTPQDAADFDGICSTSDIDVLIVSADDYLWGHHDTWAWTRPPLYVDANFRAIPCGFRYRPRPSVPTMPR